MKRRPHFSDRAMLMTLSGWRLSFVVAMRNSLCHRQISGADPDLALKKILASNSVQHLDLVELLVKHSHDRI